MGARSDAPFPFGSGPGANAGRHSAHTGLQMPASRASGAHVQKYAALRVAAVGHFRLGLNEMATGIPLIEILPGKDGPAMSTPFFADLVRELAQEGGTGPLTPTGAVPGHRRFAVAVPAGATFHYAIAGIAHPAQWETGLGHIDTGGKLVRDSVAASSNAGAPVDFAAGLKTIALTVGAAWYSERDAEGTALAGAIAAKQPLSTGHSEVAAASAGDLLTVRRGSDWVNVPAATLPYRDAAGRHGFGGPIDAQDGSATIPAISFSADADTGLFRPGANILGMAAGGSERARLTATGLGIGIAPAVRLHVYTTVADSIRLETSNARGTGNLFQSWFDASGRKGYFGYSAADDRFGFMNEMNQLMQFGTNAVQRLVIQADGHTRAASDNSYSIGTSAFRWSVVYAGTGAINTSDMRDKSWRGGATAAELRAARRIAGELGFYQWIDAIEAKGPEQARYHFGVRAQRVWAIMADEGLVEPIGGDGAPGKTPYAFLCWDRWEPDGGGEAVDRFGVRPDQLALFLIAALDARLAVLEGAA